MRTKPNHSKRTSMDKRKPIKVSPQDSKAERIAKYLARSGVASRRESEKLVADGRISVKQFGSNKVEVIDHPSHLITSKDQVFFDKKPIAGKQQTRLWLYHKPVGLITSHSDPQDRPTVFQNLPSTLPRVISIGRLDLNSEGLLLLTNDGELSRLFESPKTGLERIYKVRVYGELDREKLKSLANGCTIKDEHYGAVQVEVVSSQGRNSWLKVTLAEGKNREIRKIMNALNLQVNRLCRLQYGPFKLNELPRGKVIEVKAEEITSLLKQLRG